MPRLEQVYLDTSVISAYFDTRNEPRRDETRKFWQQLQQYSPCISEVVLNELSRISNIELKDSVSMLIKNFHIYSLNENAQLLAQEYLDEGILPYRSINDAFHLAIATINNISVLVSWNFQHIVKRRTKTQVNLVNSLKGYKPIEIVSPLDF